MCWLFGVDISLGYANDRPEKTTNCSHSRRERGGIV